MIPLLHLRRVSTHRFSRVKQTLAVLVALGPLGVFAADGSTALVQAEAAFWFDAKVAPILSRHCIECHDSTTRKGKLDLSRKSAAFAGGKDGRVIVPGRAEDSPLWQAVAADEMPDDRPPLSAEEKEILRQWINAGAAWPGEEIDPLAHTRKAGVTQNWVRRLTVPEYVETVRATLGVDIAEQASRILPTDTRADGFRNTAYNLTVDFGHVAAYARMAGVIVDKLDAPAFSRQLEAASDLTPAGLDAFVSRMGGHLLRGALEPREHASFRRVADAVVADGGNFESVAACVIEAMLQSPRFLYRIEDQRSPDGRVHPVALPEFASRLSYMVWGAPPDAELTGAAEDARLADTEEIEVQVQRMLADPRALEQSLRFLDGWLDLDRLEHLRPDPRRFPQWNPRLAADMRAETRVFFEEIVWKQQRPLTDLLNAQVTFVTPRLARHYGLKDPRKTPGPGVVADGVLALYQFDEGGGAVIYDTAGAGDPLNLAFADLSPVRWDGAGLMTIGSPRIATVGGANRLAESIKTAGAFTVEAWITPTERKQTGPARVLSLSADSSRRNLTLAQDGDKWEVRLRTTRTNANGVPGLSTPAGAARAGGATHLVFTFGAGGQARLFLNGQEKAAGEIGGDLSNWDISFPLVLANEADGRRPWRGLFHRVAFYGRALSAEEVKRNHAAGKQTVVAPKAQTLARYDLSRVPARGGLLTQGSVLTVGGEDASMVARGLFVLHDLLHSAVGSAPAGVDTTPVPTRPGLSHRAVAEGRLSQASCTGCHSKFEPLAFGLEKFDGLGAYHDIDAHGNRLREDGEILLPGREQPATFRTIAEMMEILAGSERVQRNFTRKFAQFALGRPLTSADAASIDQVHHLAQEGGGTYASLVAALAVSDLLRLSRPENVLLTVNSETSR